MWAVSAAARNQAHASACRADPSPHCRQRAPTCARRARAPPIRSTHNHKQLVLRYYHRPIIIIRTAAKSNDYGDFAMQGITLQWNVHKENA